MPQIWLSIDELSNVLDLDRATVERQVGEMKREINTVGDGVQRVLLSEAMTREYLRIAASNIAQPAEDDASPPAPSAATGPLRFDRSLKDVGSRLWSRIRDDRAEKTIVLKFSRR